MSSEAGHTLDVVVFNEDEWPLVKIEIPHKFSDDVWERGLSGIGAVLAKGQKFAIVTLRGGPPTAKQRKTVAEFLSKNEAAFRSLCLGWAVVAESPLIRGAITAITWLRPPPFHQQAFSNAAEAIAWCHERLRSRS